MLACLTSAAVLGIEACPVQVEVDVSFGLPAFTMVGLPDAAVRESRDRVRAAIRNSGYEFPSHRITVNLAPADVRKAGSWFDLPIALALLATTGTLARRAVPDTIVLGELSLDGALQGVRGVLPVAAAARRLGVPRLLVPPANAAEAEVVSGLDVLVAATLPEALAALTDPSSARPRPSAPPRPPAAGPADDLADVQGQLLARRALEIAAAGAHNLLLVGPPGSGKTLLARRLAGLLPPLTPDEAVECTAVHSVAGLLPDGVGLMTSRPFRAPHHTISTAALVGGGSQPRPGEVSLAHHGVLFLDETPEFERRALEVLRQPLEDGAVTVTRMARSSRFPARFLLVAAMNPCPCGYLGHPQRPCRCTPQQIHRYQSRLSGPLRDRIDLAVTVAAVPPAALDAAQPGEATATVAARVRAARVRQGRRAARLGIDTNAGLPARELAAACRATSDARQLLLQAARRLGLSARAYHRVLRVARTIADLADVAVVERTHVAEALQFRQDPCGLGAEAGVHSCPPDVTSSARPRPAPSPSP